MVLIVERAVDECVVFPRLSPFACGRRPRWPMPYWDGWECLAAVCTGTADRIFPATITEMRTDQYSIRLIVVGQSHACVRCFTKGLAAQGPSLAVEARKLQHGQPSTPKPNLERGQLRTPVSMCPWTSKVPLIQGRGVPELSFGQFKLTSPIIGRLWDSGLTDVQCHRGAPNSPT